MTTFNTKPFLLPPRHLYIHWPFCSFKCHYCDFVAFEQHADHQAAYHEVLLAEIRAFAKQYAYQTPIDTIFIGGGTPSLYPLPWITELFSVLRSSFDLSNCSEITLESNPADIDEEKLDCWHSIGINRLSVGVQSLDDEVLLKLNRRQRASDVQRVMKIAPKYITNLSVDLILGLPDVSPAMWEYTIAQATNWPIKHLSMYFLTIHEKTPLYFNVARGKISLPDEEYIVTLYDQTIQQLEAAGIVQYEISNFACNGFQSLHNTAYWERKPYKGFGVGASSFDGSGRYINTNNLVSYMKSSQNVDCIVPHSHEIITPKQALLEHLMLSLRQNKGLDLQSMVYLLDPQELVALKNQLPILASAGLVTVTNDRVCLTHKGMALENEVVLRLFQ
ncbi:radical SAM family heme chaperone HemW [Candidatus Dependentiae bacterium]|nr:radical SAM family heme chaperone HemW [Candidatus Dependentiae bacterium]